MSTIVCASNESRAFFDVPFFKINFRKKQQLTKKKLPPMHSSEKSRFWGALRKQYILKIGDNLEFDIECSVCDSLLCGHLERRIYLDHGYVQYEIFYFQDLESVIENLSLGLQMHFDSVVSSNKPHKYCIRDHHKRLRKFKRDYHKHVDYCEMLGCYNFVAHGQTRCMTKECLNAKTKKSLVDNQICLPS